MTERSALLLGGIGAASTGAKERMGADTVPSIVEQIVIPFDEGAIRRRAEERYGKGRACSSDELALVMLEEAGAHYGVSISEDRVRDGLRSGCVSMSHDPFAGILWLNLLSTRSRMRRFQPVRRMPTRKSRQFPGWAAEACVHSYSGGGSLASKVCGLP